MALAIGVFGAVLLTIGVFGAVLHCESGVPGVPDPLVAPLALSTGLVSGGSLTSPRANIPTVALFCAEDIISF